MTKNFDKLYHESFYPFPNAKILDETKLKAYTDKKFHVAKMTISLSGVENTMGKGENAVNQHFLLFPQCFPQPSLESLKQGIVL